MLQSQESDLLKIRAQNKEKAVKCYACEAPMPGVLDSNIRGKCEPCGGYSTPYWADTMKREVIDRKQFRHQRGIH